MGHDGRGMREGAGRVRHRSQRGTTTTTVNNGRWRSPSTFGTYNCGIMFPHSRPPPPQLNPTPPARLTVHRFSIGYDKLNYRHQGAPLPLQWCAVLWAIRMVLWCCVPPDAPLSTIRTLLTVLFASLTRILNMWVRWSHCYGPINHPCRLNLAEPDN
jgi:hypothetical protein